MIDTVQLVLLLVIVILTVLLVVLGIQVFLILKDLRKTVLKANKVLDGADKIAENISMPLSSLSSLTSGLKAGSFLTILKLIRSFLSHDEGEKKHHKE